MWKNKGSHEGLVGAAWQENLILAALIQRWHTGIWGSQNKRSAADARKSNAEGYHRKDERRGHSIQTVRQAAGFASMQSSRKQSCVKYNSMWQAYIAGSVKSYRVSGTGILNIRQETHYSVN